MWCESRMWCFCLHDTYNYLCWWGKRQSLHHCTNEGCYKYLPDAGRSIMGLKLLFFITNCSNCKVRFHFSNIFVCNFLIVHCNISICSIAWLVKQYFKPGIIYAYFSGINKRFSGGTVFCFISNKIYISCIVVIKIHAVTLQHIYKSINNCENPSM